MPGLHTTDNNAPLTIYAGDYARSNRDRSVPAGVDAAELQIVPEDNRL